MIEAGYLGILVKMGFVRGFLLAALLLALLAGVALAARYAAARLDMELMEERLRDLEREQDARKREEA